MFQESERDIHLGAGNMEACVSAYDEAAWDSPMLFSVKPWNRNTTPSEIYFHISKFSTGFQSDGSRQHAC